MSRKETSNDGSLDLLLDTICNTFGGVLFISLLVVVMLNLTSKEVSQTPASKASQTALINGRKELNRTQRGVAGLRKAIELQEQAKGVIVDPKLAELVRKLAGAQETHGGLEDGRSEQVGNIADMLADLNQRNIALQTTKDSLIKADQRLRQEMALRSKTSTLPTPKVTDKAQVVLFLRKGRLCSYVERDPDGQLVISDAECEVKEEGGQTFVVPKPNTGTRVDPAGDHRHAITNKLAIFDKEKHYLKIFVWPDSFEHFSVVRTVIVAKGFQYSLNPIPADGKIFIGTPERPDIVF